MERRTISNLSRELGVSRPTIYKTMEELKIGKHGKELSLAEWTALTARLKNTAGKTEKKKAEKLPAGEKYKGPLGNMTAIKDLALAEERATNIAIELVSEDNGEPISGLSSSSLNARLGKSRQEFDFNKQMILIFQKEIADYYQENNATTKEARNGMLMSIPAVVNLDKYIKLNIALSKLISDLESDLDLTVDGEEDPF